MSTVNRVDWCLCSCQMNKMSGVESQGGEGERTIMKNATGILKLYMFNLISSGRNIHILSL